MTPGPWKAAPIPAALLDEPVLDALGQLKGKWQPEFVDRLITMYIETALTLLRDLKIGSEKGRINPLHQASHALKACSATIGAASLAAFCAELEGMARAGAVP